MKVSAALTPALLSALLIAGCATTPGGGHGKIGAFGPPPASSGITPPTDKTPLTAEALRACVDERQQVQDSQSGVATDQGGVQAKAADLKARQAALEAEKPAAGAPRKTILDYNAKVKALQTEMDTFNASVTQTNGRIQAINDTAKKFNTDCSGHSFYQDDLDTIMKDHPNLKL